jgi:hypothetical protein
MSCKMIKPKLRKIAIVLSSLAVLSGGLGVDTAHARDGGFPYEQSGLEPLSSHQSLAPAWIVTLTRPASADRPAHRHGSAP